MAVNLVNVEQVSKVYGTRALLDGVSLGVSEGDRIGVVGRNGDGKTTLIRMLAKLEEADTGRVTHNGGLRLGVLTQHDSLDPKKTIRQEVIGDLADHEWAGSAKIRDVLTGLFGGLALPGFEHGLDTVIAPLSGGERRRIALAKLLIDEQDLIVLDEPTNHLDVEGISWLAGHLRARRSALVCVTHDRWFLDQVCTRMWDVQRGTVHEYEGGYSDYVFARAERERIAATEESKRQNLMRKELAWLRRGAPARTSKPRYRIEAANELIADVPPPRDTSELMKFANARLGKTVFDLEDVTVQAGPKTLLTHLTWQLGPGDRIGLVGVNGAGKTSLLRALAEAARTQGDEQPAAGKIVVGKTVKLAYLSQEVSELNPNLRVLEAVQQVRDRVDLGKGREMTAGQLCEQFGFTKEKQWTPVGDLSGGERRRLQILRLLMDEPNVLFLDEPTNDLDIETLTQLEDLLDGWPGSMIVISHDRFFIERTTDRVMALLGDRTLRMLPRGIDEYLERRQRMEEESTPSAAAPRTATAPAAAPAVSAQEARAAKKELQKVERQLDKLSTRETALHKQIADNATDFEKVAGLDAELRELVTERDELEMRWLELAEDA
ncbi:MULTISPECIES: ABC-F family ATP-binding cassette domain-containing protein [Streptomyces]|uniref:ABC transporter ATP-binding protein n=1 Tax=Streptomyces griseus subsp. griseus (strain JCM 4626 / CBS 651.72 / NBRC 13350 / KCC S-0626 / ISP 5235) TaxID=455632 RepID=B1VUG5_STRGG|nr:MULTISPECIES: ABC-F family ATP-binding cassette domain-containing protein [Streptomyces]MYR15670.1 ATP-binding cassette domain-containing protein [Streptomyces sp. SID724]MYR52016.1 ATP-binding cassette domain-containing protein [Streptomyces sp. SID4928]EGE43984.1 ABC transporter related protein [Streptomyces sp. ACT-1]NEB54097.1 ABC-F family ATP-binding cassette domain-containing protein [Streptomyces griseus]SCD49870.1 ATP-binding cassette, subfamily F, uup [Streptomyces sp. OspMP-M43]